MWHIQLRILDADYTPVIARRPFLIAPFQKSMGKLPQIRATFSSTKFQAEHALAFVQRP